MSQDNALNGLTRRVIAHQLLIACLVAAGFWGVQGFWQAQSALYGGLVTIVMAYLLGRRVARLEDMAGRSQSKDLLLLSIGFIQRFLLILVLFGVGFAILKLDPLAAIIGFGLTHLAYLISARQSVDTSK